MRKLLNILIMALPVCAWAQTPVATVTSTTQFELRGAGVTPGQGVPSWPVMPGDTVKAGNASVTFTFSDGSSIILDPQSVGKVDLSGKTPVFQLETGSIHYSLKSKAAVNLVALGKPVAATRVSGVVKIANGHVATGWWTPGHTAMAVGAAGASTAAGIAVTEATSGGPAVSPSK
jgi:hypothetical protein